MRTSSPRPPPPTPAVSSRGGDPAKRGGLIGDWEPGHFRPEVTLWAKLTLMTAMMIRGIDYTAGDSGDTARRLSEVEAAAPLWMWGSAFLLAATIGFLGMTLHRRALVLWAHVSGGALYLALATGVTIDVAHRAEDPHQGVAMSMAAALIAFIAAGLAMLRRTRSHYDWWVVAAWGVAVTVGVLAIGLDGLRSGSILFAVGGLHIFMAVGTAEMTTRANIERVRSREC